MINTEKEIKNRNNFLCFTIVESKTIIYIYNRPNEKHIEKFV